MAAASLQILTQGRGPGVFPNLSTIQITVTLTATVYSAVAGGAPIDLTSILQQAAPSGFDGPQGIQALHPSDVVGVIALSPSTNGFIPGGFTLGTPTYTVPPGMSSTDASAVPGFLATCPAWIRLTAIGATSTAGSGFGQPADGAITDAFTCLLVVNRNGANT